MKYKIILKTTNKHKERVEMCLDTWLKDQDYVCLTDKLTNEFNEISGSTREDYYSAEEKTLFMINHVKDSGLLNEYDWLAFIDDDAILNIKMFNHVLPYMNKDFVYGLKMHGVYEKAPSLVYPSGGSGYFISPSLIQKSLHMVNNDWGVEDAAVGKWMEQNNIKLEDHININNRRHHLKLNGWFPFGEEKNKLSYPDSMSPDVYPWKIIEKIKDHDWKSKNLNTCMTHHYIRWKPLMEYIHKSFQNWEPEHTF
jgi:hypothetical protein